MKIDGKYSTQDTDAAKGTDAARKVTDRGSVKAGDRAGAGGSDKVELSSDARLLAAALKTAELEPVRNEPIRTELVEAMKLKVAAGKVGNDSGRLADRIIDDLLKD